MNLNQLPVVIEEVTEEKTIWLLSFDGINPQSDDCIELTKDQCFWLSERIKKIDPNLLRQTN